MTDPRVAKLAEVLIHYSLAVKPGDQMYLATSPLAEELNLAVYEQAVKAGAHIWLANSQPGVEEIFFQHASDAQIDYVSPISRLVMEKFDVRLVIEALHNTRNLSGIDPERMARASKARRELFKIFTERVARKEMRWCLTVYPTQAEAQEADMSLNDYTNFVYSAGMLDRPDPVAAWREMHDHHERVVQWLAGKQEAVLKGENIDLHMSIAGRSFVECSGQENFPDGEIFTSPVEDSVNGWVRFGYPAIFAGQEVTDIELWFENGKIVKEKASKGQDTLTKLLDTDPGARYLGEWGIGTNYGIQRFVKNMLFDEKIGGTIHLAVGMGFEEAGGHNESGLHWDMLCDMAHSEVHVDGELFYRDGKLAI